MKLKLNVRRNEKNTYKLPINVEPKLEKKRRKQYVRANNARGGTTSSDGNSKTVTVYLPKKQTHKHQIIMQKFVNRVIATEKENTVQIVCWI